MTDAGGLPTQSACLEGLDALELVRVRLPMRRPLVSGHGAESIRDVVLVRALGADGVEGWGECSALGAPTYTGEYTDGAWAVLRDHLVPAALASRIDFLRGHPMASAAVELALTDRWLRSAHRSLLDACAVAAADRSGLAWTAVLGVQATVDELLAAAASARGALADRLKLKIRPGWDLEPVAAVRAAFPDVVISVDANGGYRRDDRDVLVAVAGALVGPPGAYVEQPLAADDLKGHAELAAASPVPLALDESITAAGDAVAAVSLGAARLVNVKPARLGGLKATLALAEVLAGLDASIRPGVFLGGMLETGVGRSAALTIGVAAGLGLRHTDLGPSAHYVEDDLTEPVGLAFDALAWPCVHPGIGLHPRPERLAEVVVDRLLIRR